MLRDRSLIPLSQQHHNGLSLCVLTERSLREDSSVANVAKLARKAIDRYELELAKSVRRATNLPMTVLGGAGSLEHINQLISTCGVVPPTPE